MLIHVESVPTSQRDSPVEIPFPNREGSFRSVKLGSTEHPIPVVNNNVVAVVAIRLPNPRRIPYHGNAARILPTQLKRLKSTINSLQLEISSATYHSGVQVETMLLLGGFMGRSLAAEAAYSGDKATFEVVLTVLREKFQPEQVRYELFSI